MIQLKRSLLTAGVLDQMTSKGAFQPKAYDLIATIGEGAHTIHNHMRKDNMCDHAFLKTQSTLFLSSYFTIRHCTVQSWSLAYAYKTRKWKWLGLLINDYKFCGFNSFKDVASNSSSFQRSIEPVWLIMVFPKPLAGSCRAAVLMRCDFKDGFIAQGGQWLLQYSLCFNHPSGRSECHCPASALANLKALILRTSVFSWERGNSCNSCVAFWI